MLNRVAFLLLLMACSAFADEPRKPLKDLNGDPLPDGSIARLGSMTRMHAGYEFTFSPDGKLTVVKSTKDIRVWDLRDGREVCHLDRRSLRILDVAALNDALLLADAQGVRVVDFAALKTVRVLEKKNRDRARVYVAPTDKRVAVVSADGGVSLHDLESREGEAGTTLCKEPLETLTFSANGGVVAGHHDKAIHVWDVRGRKKLCSIEWDVEVHQAEFRWGWALSSDGTRLGTILNSKVRLWSTSDGHQLRGFNSSKISGSRVLFSPDGTRLNAFDRDGGIHELSVTSGKSIVVRDGSWGSENPWLGAHSPTQLIATLGGDWVYVSDLRTGRSSLVLGPVRLDRVWFVRPGVAACRSSNSLVIQWQTKDGTILSQKDESVRGYRTALSPDGKLRAKADDDGTPTRFVISEEQTGRFQRQYDLDSRWSILSGGLAWSPDSRLIAVVSGGEIGYRVELVEAATGRARARFDIPAIGMWLKKGFPGGCSTSFSHDGRSLLVVGWGTVIISLKERKKTYLEDAKRSALSPDGRLLATLSENRDEVITILDVGTPGNTAKVTSLRGHEDYISGLAFSSDGKQLVSCGYGAALVWEMEAVRARVGKPLPEPQPKKPANAKQLAAWFDTLERVNAEKAGDAMRCLEREGSRIVTLFAERLGPAEGAAPDKVRELVRVLDSRRFADRDKASRELERMGESAATELGNLLKGELSPEVSLRIRAILRRLDGDPNAEQRRALRAVELLEKIGTAETEALLRKLAKGDPAATLTREAKVALDRRLKR